ncbi:HalOD1 output domain-containing protein [Halovenus marina]|jgi:uncharacterized ParB-like nuclease family protein|uniref:HalOD1 output domain-containing protein n=1 Tax=Halovenus marina TaxID=3396621 RepID=UPI003F551F89
MAQQTEATSVQVVHSVADTTTTEVSDLPPLYDAIDPDALDAFVAGMTDGSVSFTYAGCEVTVDSDETITVAEPVDRTTAEVAVSDD